MISLVIDTCTSNVVIGLLKDVNIIDQMIETNDQDLSGKFICMVDDLLRKNGVTMQEVDTIFVAIGSGSFTGIRIGVTFAKVAAWSLNKKVVPFSSLELMATTSVDAEVIVPMIDARRGYVFGGIYGYKLDNLYEDSYIKLDNLKDIALKYDDVAYISVDGFDINVTRPNIDIAKLVEKHLNDVGVNPHSLNPNYLKKTEAEEKLAGE